MGLRITDALLAQLDPEDVYDIQEGLLGHMPRQSPHLDSADANRENATYAKEFALRSEQATHDPCFFHFCPHGVDYRWGGPCITCVWDAYDRLSAPDAWFDWNQYDDRRYWDARAERYFDSFYSDFLGDDENLRAWEELELLNPTWPPDQFTAYRPAAAKDLRARRLRATRFAEQRRLQSVLNGTNKGSIDELATKALATIWQLRYTVKRHTTPPHRVLRALSQDLSD